MPEESSPCRDFERGVCSRGENCRFFHPERTEPAEGVKLPICKDFQNKGCDRRKCKFLHVTQEEEAVYDATGQLPPHRGRPELMYTTAGPAGAAAAAGPPKNVCKDFLNGKCDRGSRCRYAHVAEGPHGDRGYGKRSRSDAYHPPPPHAAGVANDAAMFEENEFLRRKITELQREVLSLREMNDTLYDQNRRYCAQLGTAASTSPTSPSSASTQVTMLSPTAPVMYPASYTQTAYPAKAVLPSSGAATGGYGYVHY